MMVFECAICASSFALSVSGLAPATNKRILILHKRD